MFCFLVGVVPTLFATVGVYLVAARTVSPLAFSYLAAPAWLVAVFVIGPLISVLAVSLAIAVSARANDVQSAQQAAGMLVLPVIGLMAPQMLGVAHLSIGAAVMICGVLVLVDVFAAVFSTSLFERETILTRWK